MDILQRTIACYDVFDRLREIPADRVGIRLCAYGFILNRDSELLVVRMKTTKKLWLPGGGVEIHESLEEGLIRETREETGIEIRVGERIHIAERFFYYEPLNEAYRATMHFFLCDALTTRCAPKLQEPEEATEHPHWVRLAHLHPAKKKADALLLQPPLGEICAKTSGPVQDWAFRRMHEVLPYVVANGVHVDPRHRFQALGPNGKSVGSGDTAERAKESAQIAGVMSPLVLPIRQ